MTLVVCLSVNTITPEPLEISSRNFHGIILWSKLERADKLEKGPSFSGPADSAPHVRGFRGFHNSTCNRIWNNLKMILLRFRKIVIQRVTAIRFRMNNVGGDSRPTGSFETKIRTDTAKFTNMRFKEIWSERLRCPSKKNKIKIVSRSRTVKRSLRRRVIKKVNYEFCLHKRYVLRLKQWGEQRFLPEKFGNLFGWLMFSTGNYCET